VSSFDPSPTIASPAEFVPADCFAPLDLESVFGRRAALEVDLGCGDGSFLAAVADQNPDRNFLGIERLRGRVRTASRKIERAGLTNARVLHSEIAYAVARLLPAGSVTVFHLMFPDPWPKRRHAPRRLVTEEFLASMNRALVPDGTVRIATDESEYFRQITRQVSQCAQFAAIDEKIAPAAASKFEKRFTEGGVAIHRLSLRKVSAVT
jgi:tRNA (guanine-N7-)-methyltransferase